MATTGSFVKNISSSTFNNLILRLLSRSLKELLEEYSWVFNKLTSRQDSFRSMCGCFNSKSTNLLLVPGDDTILLYFFCLFFSILTCRPYLRRWTDKNQDRNAYLQLHGKHSFYFLWLVLLAEDDSIKRFCSDVWLFQVEIHKFVNRTYGRHHFDTFLPSFKEIQLIKNKTLPLSCIISSFKYFVSRYLMKNNVLHTTSYERQTKIKLVHIS